MVVVLRSIVVATVVAMHSSLSQDFEPVGKLTLLLSCISPVGLANGGNLLFLQT